MKSYNHLFEKLIDPEIIRQAIYNASNHKTSRDIVKNVLNNINYYIYKTIYILKNNLFKPRKHKSKIISDGPSQKEREIIQPDFAFEQIIHHAVMIILKPIFMKGMYEYNCGSIPKRGNMYGKRYIERIIKKDYKNTQYVSKLDIKKFFQNVDNNILKNKLAKIIHDKRFLNILFIIIDSYENGIPLGYYTSQWFANFYLATLDRYIKQTLRIKYYIRYMDDIVLFADIKEILHDANIKIMNFVKYNLGLTIKQNYQIFKLAHKKYKHMHERFLDYMGYRFYRQYTTLRKSIMLKLTRKVNKIKKKTNRTWYDYTQLMSYYGWIKHTDTYNSLFKKALTNNKIYIKNAKNVISFHSKYVNKEAA